jgi:hypothetical protein
MKPWQTPLHKTPSTRGKGGKWMWTSQSRKHQLGKIAEQEKINLAK